MGWLTDWPYGLIHFNFWEEKPMKHKFKNGDKVRIKSSGEAGLCYYVGPCPDREGMHVLMPVFPEGKFQVCFTEVIEPYKEPIKFSGWVNVDPSDGYDVSKVYKTRKVAEEMRAHGYVTVYVTGTEGAE